MDMSGSNVEMLNVVENDPSGESEPNIEDAVDRLAEVREILRALKAEEKELKEMILESGSSSIEGKRFWCEVKVQESRSIDKEKVREFLGDIKYEL